MTPFIQDLYDYTLSVVVEANRFVEFLGYVLYYVYFMNLTVVRITFIPLKCVHAIVMSITDAMSKSFRRHYDGNPIDMSQFSFYHTWTIDAH